MDASNKTSLSVGLIIAAVLNSSEEIQAAGVTDIFPVATDKAVLPYIAYKRANLDPNPNKRGNADSAAVEINIYTEKYGQGIEIAEIVRECLDGKQAEIDGLTMRSCYLSDCDETWQDDAFCQTLVFTIKI